MVTNFSILRMFHDEYHQLKQAYPGISELDINTLLDEKIPRALREDQRTRLSSVSDRYYAFQLKELRLPELLKRLESKGYTTDFHDVLGIGSFIYASKGEVGFTLSAGPLGYIHLQLPPDADPEIAASFVEELFSGQT